MPKLKFFQKEIDKIDNQMLQFTTHFEFLRSIENYFFGTFLKIERGDFEYAGVSVTYLLGELLPKARATPRWPLYFSATRCAPQILKYFQFLKLYKINLFLKKYIKKFLKS